ncbi:glycerophosphodiester phosphodiesterase [Brachybacterium endophyticum]|uniref:Glycerophosphodiester phosphodiesterase n=1 Tax=Brachybacterium endophyticum TaxID=2182385 RepID=A0A2U2RIL2_9MICO|nr:glycerophosphodiester phosphodiesterase family protein [Brachybacterium endophyticum]PWH05696.1 glycerophosphodiester phosphodiesterase [Brachybacterium endophyticum]
MSSWSTDSTENPGRFLPGRRPRRIAHRGLALDGAENTLRAFADALAAGADMLETDTRASADGIALAVHDEDLRRISGDPRRIADLREKDLEDVLVAGVEPLARLEDVLGEFTSCPVNIDVKDEAAITPAVEAIARTCSADRVCVTSFRGSVASRTARAVAARTGVTPMRSPSREVLVGFLGARLLELPDPVVRLLLSRFGALQVPVSHAGIPIVTAANVAAAHRAGCEVQVWTIDDPEEMRGLLELGVDGIITNRVDLLSALLEGRGEAGPVAGDPLRATPPPSPPVT